MKDQVTAWMGDISPGALIRIDPYEAMDLMRLSFGFERADTAGDVRNYRSTNVGFGLTYTLPVLVALLSSPAARWFSWKIPKPICIPAASPRLAS